MAITGQTTTIGLDKVEIGPIAGDGGISTSFAVLGVTVRGTAVFSSTPVTTTDIAPEESDNPLFSQNTGGGTYNFAWSTYNVDPSVLQEFFGGTVTGTAPNQVWHAPATMPTVERSVRMTSQSGLEIAAVRVKLTAELALNFQRETPGQINITGVVLTPTKAATDAFTITQLAAA